MTNGLNDRLGPAMDEEGVRMVERLTWGFRVTLKDGRSGTGFSPRGAISNAKLEQAAA